MTSKKKKDRMGGLVMFDTIDFYKAVKRNAIRHGFTEMKAAIYGTLALEECLREAGDMYKLTFLSTIGSVALPDVEKIEPANDEEESEKRDLIAFYNVKKDKALIDPLFTEWQKVNGRLRIAQK